MRGNYKLQKYFGNVQKSFVHPTMRRITALILLVFCALSNALSKNHWNDLIPRGKEVDYNYEATLTAGISLSDDYSSLFHLRGVLHVQAGGENELLLRLTNLNYTLDNGKISEFPNKVPIKLGDHMSLLTSPFKIMMDDDGVFEDVSFEETTPEFIRNIQKGLVNMFLVNWEGLLLNSTKPQTIRGSDLNLWNVIPNDNTLTIEMLGTVYGSDTESIHNVDSFTCDESFEEPLSRDLQRIYTVDKSLNLMKKIVSNGGIYYHPFNGVSPPYSMYVIQTLEMINIHDIEKTMIFEKEIKVDTLTMVFTDPNEPLEHVTNKESLVPLAVNLIQEVIQFIETRKIDLTMPDFEKQLLPSQLRNILKHLDVTLLENLLKFLIEKGQKETDVFYQMIAQVGTHDSIKFIISLIKTKKMNEFQAIRALQKMPFYVIVNKEILEDLHVLLNLGVSWEVQNAANLCFGSFLYRTRKFGHYIPPKEEQKLIKNIIRKLKATNKIEEKYSYLNTLYNVRSSISIDRLSEIMNNKELKMKTLTSLHKAMADRYDTESNMVQILIDRTLPTDVRIIAFYTLMKSRPRLSKLINIFWIMQSETDVDLYQFYYTYMKSIANSKNPCEKTMRLKAIQMMKYMQTPYRHSLTQYNLIDHYNEKINRGENFDWFIVDSSESLLLHFGYGRTIMNMNMRPFSFYLRLSGLQGKLLSDLKMNIRKGMKLFNYNDILKEMMKVMEHENVLLDIVFSENSQIVLADTLHKSNFMEKLKFYFRYVAFLEENIKINFDFLYYLNVPNTIGLELYQLVHKAETGRFPLKINLDYKDNIISLNIDGKMDWSDYYLNGLFVHNSIAQSWQGVGKSTIYDNVVPLSIDISLNIQQDLLKISWKGLKKIEDNVFATRSYVGHFVQNYEILNTGNLKKFNPKARAIVILPTNNDVRNDHIIIEREDQNLGYKSTVTVFDTEDSKSMDVNSPLVTEGLDICSYLEHALKYLQFDDNLLSNILTYSMEENDLMMMYNHGRRGVLILWEPSKINPITNIDLSVRLDHEITKETPSLILPGMKIILKGSFSLKNQETLIKRWDANVNWELNNGHTQNSVKGQLTRTKPGESDYKICVEGLETYSGTGLEITGHLNIKMGETPDGTCKDDGGNIDVSMKGERLREQIKGNYNFESCHQHVFLQMPSKMPSYSCLADRTSIRKYEFEIKSKNAPGGLQRLSQRLLEFLKVKYYDHYSIETSNESIKENIKILLTFPVSNDVLDMEMIKGNHHYKLTALPAVNFRRYGLFIPDNLHYSNVQKMMHITGMTHICSADDLNIINVNNTLLSNVITEDWTLALGGLGENPDVGFWLKKVDNKLAIKLVVRMHILLVLPMGNSFSLTIDGKNVPNELLLNNEWLTLLTKGNMLTVLVKECGSQLVYNTKEMMLEVPRLNEPLAGRCL